MRLTNVFIIFFVFWTFRLVEATYFFKDSSFIGGSFLPFYKDKGLPHLVAEDGFMTSTLGMSVCDGVGGSDIPAGYFAYGLCYQSVMTYYTNFFGKLNPLETSLESYTATLKGGLGHFMREYYRQSLRFNKADHNNARPQLTDDYITAYSTFVSAYIDNRPKTGEAVLKFFQKGDSQLIIFRLHKEKGVYYYAPVLVTNDFQADFNASPQFSSKSFFNIKRSDPADEVKGEFLLSRRDIVFMATDGLYDNLFLSFITYLLNLYIKNMYFAFVAYNGKIDLKDYVPTDLIESALGGYVKTLKAKRQEFEEYYEGVKQELEEKPMRARKVIKMTPEGEKVLIEEVLELDPEMIEEGLEDEADEEEEPPVLNASDEHEGRQVPNFLDLVAEFEAKHIARKDLVESVGQIKESPNLATDFEVWDFEMEKPSNKFLQQPEMHPNLFLDQIEQLSLDDQNDSVHDSETSSQMLSRSSLFPLQEEIENILRTDDLLDISKNVFSECAVLDIINPQIATEFTTDEILSECVKKHIIANIGFGKQIIEKLPRFYSSRSIAHSIAATAQKFYKDTTDKLNPFWVKACEFDELESINLYGKADDITVVAGLVLKHDHKKIDSKYVEKLKSHVGKETKTLFQNLEKDINYLRNAKSKGKINNKMLLV